MIEDLIITCRTTCGCGNKLVSYTKQTETTHYLLTCKPFSDKFNHPLLIAVDKKSPIFIKAEKWDNIRRDVTCVDNPELRTLLYELEQENKQLKEGRKIDTKSIIDYNMENQNLKQKLEKIKITWDLINVDLDAPEDCVKMCNFIKQEILHSQEKK